MLGPSEKQDGGETKAGVEARPEGIAASKAAGEEVFHFLSRACPISV